MAHDVVLWWIKRDIRLADNAALAGACSAARAGGASVLPLFVFDPALVDYPDCSRLHLRAVLQALAGLRASLRRLGSELAVVGGPLPHLFARLGTALGVEVRITELWAHEETSLHAGYRRDREVRGWAARRGLRLREIPRNGVVRALTSRDRRIAIVERRLAAPEVATPSQLPMAAALRRALERRELPAVDSFDVPDPRAGIMVAGSGCYAAVERCDSHRASRAPQRVDEPAAARVLASFLSRRCNAYARGMSSPNTAAQAASRLSVHLAWGTVSLRTVIARVRSSAAGGARSKLHPFRSRLYWHDHFVQRLEDQPDTEFVPINPAFAALETNGYLAAPAAEYERRLSAWLHGATGYPLVDATVRALRTTGYAPFRMRAMIVSFATHVLRLWWRDVLYPMAQWMADYVPGIHLSQLQMQAALTGINTIRVYNPTKQLVDHDRATTFVRRWIPELRQRDPAEIHALPELALPPYTPPVVEYRVESQIAKRFLYAIKNSADGRAAARIVLQQHGSRKGGGPRRRT